MPDRTPCPRCGKTGFVRFETVIQANKSERHYYCGTCTHAWVIREDGIETGDEPQDPLERSRPPR